MSNLYTKWQANVYTVIKVLNFRILDICLCCLCLFLGMKDRGIYREAATDSRIESLLIRLKAGWYYY